jgi:hypothetical protein
MLPCTDDYLKQTFDIDDLKREGKIKFSYTFTGSPGGITLWDVESNKNYRRSCSHYHHANPQTNSQAIDRNEISRKCCSRIRINI